MVAAGHSVGCLPETKPADIQVWDISWKILGGTGCSCEQSHLTTVKLQCIQGLSLSEKHGSHMMTLHSLLCTDHLNQFIARVIFLIFAVIAPLDPFLQTYRP